MAKINTLFMTKMAKTHTLWGHTYLYNPCEGVLLPGKLQVTSSLGICRAFDNFSCLRVVHLLHHASQVCPSDEVSSKVMLSFISGFQGRLLCCFSLVSEPVLNCCDMRKWLNYVTYKCWKYLFCLYNRWSASCLACIECKQKSQKSQILYARNIGRLIPLIDAQWKLNRHLSTSESVLVLQYEYRYHDKISWCHHNDIAILHE